MKKKQYKPKNTSHKISLKSIFFLLLLIIIPLIYMFIGGYWLWVVGYLYLWLIQGYAAWFLYFKCDQPFVGYSVTMALGAYGTILLNIHLNWPIYLAIIVSMFLCSLLAVFFFVVTSRSKGFYVTMISFLAAILFPMIIEATRDISGGRSGIYFTGLFSRLGETVYILLITFILLMVLGFFIWFLQTKTGKILTLISENDELTQAVGINTFKYKILAYAIAGLISGLGGCLYVNYIGFISSVDINVFTTVYITFVPILGGSIVFYGPVLGVMVIWLLPELFVPLERYSDIVYGLIFLSIIMVLPSGIGPSVEKFYRKIKQSIFETNTEEIVKKNSNLSQKESGGGEN